MGIDHPDFTESQWILSEAELFSSALADTAWHGRRNRSSRIRVRSCLPSPIEVALTPGDYPGCQNARVMKTWEA